MAFDGVFLKKITAELGSAEQCHIDKIYQPSRDEMVLLLRKKDFAKRLLISAKSGAARIHFTDVKYENPASPPMFCMLARKYFSSARLVKIVQKGFERVAELVFETTDELGDRVSPRIVCELIGNQANIILVNGNGKIIDAVRRSDAETGQRMLLPGALYRYPDSLGKLELRVENTSELCEAVLKNKEVPLSLALLKTIDGFSPIICREIAFRAYLQDVLTDEISEPQKLQEAVADIAQSIYHRSEPVILINDKGVPTDFSYTDITQYGDMFKRDVCESFSCLLDTFYGKREAAARMQHSAADMLKCVTTAYSRAQKRIAARKNDLKTCENREELRIYGELLKANLYAIKPGSSFAEVQNYYDEELKTIRIPLNPALSPSSNAAKFFKDYKKSYTAEQTLTSLIEADENEIRYLDTVIESINRCENLADLNEIRDELTEAGYLHQKGAKSQRRKKGGFNIYVSKEGYRVLVGKNNRQNDELTTKTAGKNDLWFHTKNIPGSHVVVFCDGNPVSDETVMAAAQLAAYYSKASESSNVPVDYTPIKYVKKPNGANLGMVIYTTNKTVFVKPDGNALVKEDL